MKHLPAPNCFKVNKPNELPPPTHNATNYKYLHDYNNNNNNRSNSIALLYLQHATLQLRLQTARLNPFKITTQTSSICKCRRQQQQQGAQQLFALLRLSQLQIHTRPLILVLHQFHLQFHQHHLLLRPLHSLGHVAWPKSFGFQLICWSRHATW